MCSVIPTGNGLGHEREAGPRGRDMHELNELTGQGQFSVDRSLGVSCPGLRERYPVGWGSQGRLPGGGVPAKP